jgi:crotonobetainyl-CoA:carnitine CoA-transferase CaiB-like acyl-CoA transferase
VIDWAELEGVEYRLTVETNTALAKDARRRHAAPLEREIERAFAARGARDWLAILERAHVPCAPVNTVADAVKLPQTAARRMVVGIPDPAIGTLYVAGNPVKMSDVPEPTVHRAPPEVDADRDAILAWLDARDRDRPAR